MIFFCRFYNPPTNQGYYGYDQQQQQQQMPQPPMPGNFSQQQQQQPANFMTPAPIQQQPHQQMPQQPRAPAAAAKPKEILPIPPEHLDLQTTFDGLRMKCMAAASHPVGIAD